MRYVFRFAVLLVFKFTSQLFYTFDVDWVDGKEPIYDGRLGIFLNHTSLFDLLFLGVLPVRVLWTVAKHGVFPGADITMNRPIAGRFIRLLASNVVTITRKRDQTWTEFLESIKPDSLILIAAEGRMKRPNGLDKEGHPMTVRGGIADLLSLLHSGRMVIAYSQGIHHVQTPGQRFPHLFKRLRIRFDNVDIETYKKNLGHADDMQAFKHAVIQDLEKRRDEQCHLLGNP